VRYHSDTTMWKQASTSHLSSRLTDVSASRLRISRVLYVLRHNCNTSSVQWTYRRTFPAPPATSAFHTDMTCRCKPTFSRATFEWDALYYIIQGKNTK
jgi:hypothetical protein